MKPLHFQILVKFRLLTLGLLKRRRKRRRTMRRTRMTKPMSQMTKAPDGGERGAHGVQQQSPNVRVVLRTMGATKAMILNQERSEGDRQKLIRPWKRESTQSSKVCGRSKHRMGSQYFANLYIYLTRLIIRITTFKSRNLWQ